MLSLNSCLFLEVASYFLLSAIGIISCEVRYYATKPFFFLLLLAGAFSCLNYVIGHPKALDVEYVMAHDAVVSSLGKILQFHRNKLNEAKVYAYFNLTFTAAFASG